MTITTQSQILGDSQLMPLPARKQEPIDQDPVVKVAINALSVTYSPRISGANPDHVRTLAAAQTELPPIIVHRQTMRVIDGVHRLGVAKLRNQDQIAVRFFTGDEADAFVLAVQSNIAHGLPLPLADRKAAAVRIIISHPQWSDRMIAAVTGLASGTLAEIRRQYLDKSDGEAIRIGQDGRARPLNRAAGRKRAADFMTDNPRLSLRQAAHAAGISPETARDVRNRMRRGEDPVAEQRGKKKKNRNGDAERSPSEPRLSAGRVKSSSQNPAEVIARLRADPALRFSETGRSLLRLLNVQLVETGDWKKVGENVPSHCSRIIANLARECAQLWEELASQAEQNATYD